MQNFSTALPMDIHVHTGPAKVIFRDPSALWIVICREGTAEYRRGRHRLLLVPNDILLLPPTNLSNTIDPQKGALYRHIALYIRITQ